LELAPRKSHESAQFQASDSLALLRESLHLGPSFDGTRLVGDALLRIAYPFGLVRFED
jgi:hypothetical protein